MCYAWCTNIFRFHAGTLYFLIKHNTYVSNLCLCKIWFSKVTFKCVYHDCRKCRLDLFYKRSTFKNLAKFTGRHLWRILCSCNFIKRRPQDVFSWKSCKTFQSIYFTEYLWATATMINVLRRSFSFLWTGWIHIITNHYTQ